MTVRQDSARKAINSRNNAGQASLLATGLKSQSWLNIKVGTFYSPSLSFSKICCYHLHFLTLICMWGRYFSPWDQIWLWSLDHDNTPNIFPLGHLDGGHWGTGQGIPGQGQELWCDQRNLLPRHFFVQFGFLINIFVHCLGLLSAVFPQKQRVKSIDWFDIENVISSESVSIFKIIIKVTALSGMTKHWQDFQFPFSRNCQIVLLDEIKSSCEWNISTHPTCHLVAPGRVLSNIWSEASEIPA